MYTETVSSLVFELCSTKVKPVLYFKLLYCKNLIDCFNHRVVNPPYQPKPLRVKTLSQLLYATKVKTAIYSFPITQPVSESTLDG